jgi:hypothetical protein
MLAREPTRAFFGSDCHRCHVSARPDAKVFQRGNRRQRGNRTCRAVEIAAVRNRIEMRPRYPARRGAVGSRQRRIKIANYIRRDLKADFFSSGAHKIVADLLARAVRRPRDALAPRVEGARPQVVKQARGQTHLHIDGRNETICIRGEH